MVAAEVTIPYRVLNAFSSSPFGGNPAAVVLLPAKLDSDALLKISKNFNLPITSFVFLSTKEPGTTQDALKFDIRWFTVEVEPALCGHGTLAAAEALFAMKDIVPPEIRVLEFQAMYDIVTARKLESGRVEIELPLGQIRTLGEEETRKLRGIVSEAFGKATSVVSAVASDDLGTKVYVLIEVDAAEDLNGAKVNFPVFAKTAPYYVNIITKASSLPGVTWETRMFAPLAGVLEDNVCGSANCLLAPYWAAKKGVQSGEQMHAQQVSPRKGALWITVDENKKIIRLSGEVRKVAEGSLFL